MRGVGVCGEKEGGGGGSRQTTEREVWVGAYDPTRQQKLFPAVSPAWGSEADIRHRRRSHIAGNKTMERAFGKGLPQEVFCLGCVLEHSGT